LRLALPDTRFDQVFEISMQKERSHCEWDFWEESSTSTTSPKKRKDWAEQLWLAQHRRRRKLALRLKEIEKERERMKLDELRMKRRHDRWGSTAKQHP
jgi:hypothetical protein